MKHPLIFWKTVLICLMLAGKTGTYADNYQPSYSTAGFYSLSNTGRTVYSMNPAWRFHKGNIKGAEQSGFNDKSWDVVSLPDGIEYLPTEASTLLRNKAGRENNSSSISKPLWESRKYG